MCHFSKEKIRLIFKKMFRRSYFLFSSSQNLDIQAAYRILGLTSSKASPEDARQKYLKLARQYHPDVSNGDDTKMKQINLAYEVVQTYVAQYGKEAMSKLKTTNNEKNEATGKDEADDGFGGFSSGDGGETAYQRRKRQRREKDQSSSSSSPLGDASRWNSRPEFEWNAAIFSVSEADAANRANHPNSFNRHFSFNDDANIFKSVRSGATVEEVARSMGRSAFAIEARMNSTQFKLRIQKMLRADRFERKHNLDGDSNEANTEDFEQGDKHGDPPGSDLGGKRHLSDKLKAQKNFQRQVHPYRDTVYRNPDYVAAKKQREEFFESDLPFLHPEEIPDGVAEKDERNNDDDFFGQFSAKRIQSAHGRSYAHLANHMRSTNRSAGMKNTRKFY